MKDFWRLPKEAAGEINSQALGDFHQSFLATSEDFYEMHLETSRRGFWRLPEEGSGDFRKKAAGDFRKKLLENSRSDFCRLLEDTFGDF